MNTGYMFKTTIGLGLSIITGFSAAAGNETIFPSALAFSILFLLYAFSTREQADVKDELAVGKAARLAIVNFVVFVAAMSLLVSLFLPAMADHFDLNGLFDGDFVRVTVNDMHEFAYSTCLLLLLNATFLFFLRRRQAASGSSR
jgi:hypothetical protein